MSSEAKEDTEEAIWAEYEKARRQTNAQHTNDSIVDDPERGFSATETDLTCLMDNADAGSDDEGDHCSDQTKVNAEQPVLTCTEYYKSMNCGNADSLGSRIPFLQKTRSLVKAHRLANVVPADVRKTQAKAQLLQEDLQRLEQVLRTRDLADCHIAECRRVYQIIAACMERLQMKRNKKKVEIASTYYALKKFFNPTPAEIEKMFDVSHHLFLTATKQVKNLAYNCSDELKWVFDVERGKTNIFRYASKLDLDYKKIKEIQACAKEKNLNLQDESTVQQLLKRFKPITVGAMTPSRLLLTSGDSDAQEKTQ